MSLIDLYNRSSSRNNIRRYFSAIWCTSSLTTIFSTRWSILQSYSSIIIHLWLVLQRCRRKLTEWPKAESEERDELVFGRIPSLHLRSHRPHFLAQVAVHHSGKKKKRCKSHQVIRVLRATLPCIYPTHAFSTYAWTKFDSTKKKSALALSLHHDSSHSVCPTENAESCRYPNR